MRNRQAKKISKYKCLKCGSKDGIVILVLIGGVMSKAKLIKLLKDDVWTLRHHLSNMSKQELRTFLIRVLKEQDRDTRHGCAEVIVDANRESACVFDCDFKYETHNACINYQDKDLVGL